MSLSGLLQVVSDDPQLQRALELAGQPAAGGADLVAPPALRPVLAAALTGVPGTGSPGTGSPGTGSAGTGSAGTGSAGAAGAGQGPGGDGQPADGGTAPGRRFVLAVTATAGEAEELTAALGSLLGPSNVACFPAWETLPHERLSPRSDTSGQRLAVLRRLAHPDPADPRSGPLAVVAAPVRSLLQPMVSGLGELEPVRLVPGQSADLEQILTALVDIGYARVDLVEKRGELAVRGGILDVFPPTEEHPLRVEFWGDTVEEVRSFKVADQRSLGTVADGIWAPPCRELLLDASVRGRAKELASEWPGLSEILGKIADGIAVEGMEALALALTDRMELLLDYVPAGGIVLACDPERIAARAADLVRTSQEFLEASWVSAAAGGQVPIDLGAAAFRPVDEVRAAAADLRVGWWTITPFRTDDQAKRQPPRTRRPRTTPPRGGPVVLAGTMTDGSRSVSMQRQPMPTGAIPRGCSVTSGSGWPTGGGWCWSPRGTGRPSGWPSC